MAQRFDNTKSPKTTLTVNISGGVMSGGYETSTAAGPGVIKADHQAVYASIRIHAWAVSTPIVIKILPDGRKILYNLLDGQKVLVKEVDKRLLPVESLDNSIKDNLYK